MHQGIVWWMVFLENSFPWYCSARTRENNFRMHTRFADKYCNAKFELINHKCLRWCFIHSSDFVQSEEFSVQLGTNVGWNIKYRVGGIVCTVRYERRLVHHVQSRRNCRLCTWCTNRRSCITVQTIPPTLYVMYLRSYLTVQTIPPTLYMKYERRLVHHIQSRRNCLYSYERTSVGTSCAKSE
jgi:hypothetical protein